MGLFRYFCVILRAWNRPWYLQRDWAHDSNRLRTPCPKHWWELVGNRSSNMSFFAWRKRDSSVLLSTCTILPSRLSTIWVRTITSDLISAFPMRPLGFSRPVVASARPCLSSIPHRPSSYIMSIFWVILVESGELRVESSCVPLVASQQSWSVLPLSPMLFSLWASARPSVICFSTTTCASKAGRT